MMSDTTHLGAVSEEDQAWSTGEWLEQALAAGYDTSVLITSPDIFAQMAVQDITEEITASTQGRVTHQYFDNEQSARAWVEQRSETVSQ
ncbi:MAG: hypothetical protein AAF632_05035 [Bacteroidota bacterium]